MSKFKVVDGNNVTSISTRSREIKQLEFEINKKSKLTDKDLIIFAYHFVRLEHPLLAQKYLNMLSKGYFEHGIYKDLTHALLAWSVSQANPLFNSEKNKTIYEFFVVIKRVLTSFEALNFTQRLNFESFKREFTEFSRTISTPHT